VALSFPARNEGVFYGGKDMKKGLLGYSLGIFVVISGLLVFAGCDSAEKARDELTGNRAVKQYHKSTKDIGKIVDRQTEKYKSLPDEDTDEGKKE
jgi:hypothetical protein